MEAIAATLAPIPMTDSLFKVRYTAEPWAWAAGAEHAGAAGQAERSRKTRPFQFTRACARPRTVWPLPRPGRWGRGQAARM